jgi:hypothetical protein
MKLSRFFKEWWRRASAASKTEAVLALATFFGKLYTVGFTVWMAGAKFSGWNAPGTYSFGIFVFALGFVTLRPYLPKRVSEKWVIEDLRRTKAVAVAISEIASAIWNKRLGPEERNSLFFRLVASIRTEVEGIVGDHESIYLNVALLLNEDEEHLRVVCRSNHDRPLARYKKSDLLVSKVLSTGNFLYEPECDFADKPYKVIFGIPVVSGPQGERLTIKGVVSIDSSQPHCFDGLSDEIMSKTLPYMSLLNLVIIADESLKGNGRGGRQYGKKR